MLAIKNESLNLDDNQAIEIDRVLLDFTTKVKNSFYWISESRVTPLDCRHRDGFSPYSHNKGGYEVEVSLHSSQLDDLGFYHKAEEHHEYLKSLIDNIGSLSDDEVWDEIDRLDDEACACFYFQAMLNSETELSIKLGMYFSDAPYFRHETDQDTVKEFEIEFKDARDLRVKLSKLLHRMSFNSEVK